METPSLYMTEISSVNTKPSSFRFEAQKNAFNLTLKYVNSYKKF